MIALGVGLVCVVLLFAFVPGGAMIFGLAALVLMLRWWHCWGVAKGRLLERHARREGSA